MRCDLHVHSNCSDGSLSPCEIIKLAEKSGISAVALCDHNTLTGLPEFIKASRDTSVTAVPGVEISCAYEGEEIHILGLFIKEEMFQEVSEYLLEINIRKMESNEILTQRLNDAGYKVNYKDVLGFAKGGIPNRVHFANALIKEGYVKTVKEAFNEILSDERGIYIPAEKLDAFDVISFLKSVGALAVLAHPWIGLNEDNIGAFLSRAKEAGLVGMECIYSTFSEEQTEKAMALVEKYGLAVSGGSDFHGTNKPDISLGEGKGNLVIPIEIYDNLKALSEH